MAKTKAQTVKPPISFQAAQGVLSGSRRKMVQGEYLWIRGEKELVARGTETSVTVFKRWLTRDTVFEDSEAKQLCDLGAYNS